ncbi:MAG: hypothetical protein AABX89_02635 [Candidatus Thermoplasmatota archaeon]
MTQSSFAAPPTPTPAAPTGGRRLQREVAHRMFAAEFNASKVEIKGQGEKDPSFLVSPLGAKVNRLHVVGVCTDVESIGATGEVWRARISDPSGIFTIYAGNYQPEAAQAISQLQPPCFLAVTGKARTYEPEPGTVYASIRPETVTVVDEATRDLWLVETARRTGERLKAAQLARADPAATAEQLVAKGVPRALAEGVLLARTPYAAVELSRFKEATVTCLSPLVSGTPIPVQRSEPRPTSGAAPAEPAEAPTTWRAPPAAPKPDAAAEAVQEALDNAILAHIQRLEGQKGARWDDVLQASATGGVAAETIEEALNRLMDKGLVYEPTLGVLKTT